MVKECQCICKEKAKGIKEWRGLTTFRIAELDVLRGMPGSTNVTPIVAKDKEEAIKKYYDLGPGASDRILIYPEGCAEIYTRPKIFPVRTISKEPRIHGAALRARGLKKAGI